jgi:hypothetical protein
MQSTQTRASLPKRELYPYKGMQGPVYPCEGMRGPGYTCEGQSTYPKEGQSTHTTYIVRQGYSLCLALTRNFWALLRS